MPHVLVLLGLRTHVAGVMSSSSPAFQAVLGLSLWLLILACEGNRSHKSVPPVSTVRTSHKILPSALLDGTVKIDACLLCIRFMFFNRTPGGSPQGWGFALAPSVLRYTHEVRTSCLE